MVMLRIILELVSFRVSIVVLQLMYK